VLSDSTLENLTLFTRLELDESLLLVNSLTFLLHLVFEVLLGIFTFCLSVVGRFFGFSFIGLILSAVLITVVLLQSKIDSNSLLLILSEGRPSFGLSGQKGGQSRGR